MSTESMNIKHEEDGLGPIPFDKKHRIMGPGSYLMAWLGGCVSIGNFSLGSSLVGGGLNLMQVILAIALGSGLVCICLVINDKLCYTTGMPYVVQLRSAFGFKGTVIPSLCRSIPAIVWYGFQSWVGASALNEISILIFGFDSMIFYFVVFHLLQVGLAAIGFKGIKAIENIGGVVIILSLGYMLFTMLHLHGDSVTQIASAPANWGLPFFSAVTSFVGVNCLVLISVGDYVREVKPGCGPVKRGGVYAAALMPATIFMGVIGLLVTNVTGIANPVVGFSRVVDNKFVVVLTLIFIIFAQVTTNLLNNSLPPIYAMMDIFKIKHKVAAIVVGLLAFATFPWELIKETSASGLNVFILIYSAFAGPIFAILVTDYYLVHKQKINLPDFYNPNGPFKGVNFAAIAAIIVGVIVSFVFVDISWIASIVPTILVYYFLKTRTKRVETSSTQSAVQ